MSTAVTICNIALARIGVSTFITSLSEASNEARVCSLFYEQTRDYVLRDFDWNFAEKRVVLADAGTPPAEWAYKYTYPSDCLRARYIAVPCMRTVRNDQRIEFKVANESGQKVIYTNQPAAELIYTYRVEDPTLFDSMFSSALSYKLASEIAMPLSVQADIGQAALKAYKDEVAVAAGHSMSESQEGPAPESEFVTVRDGFSGNITKFTQDY